MAGETRKGRTWRFVSKIVYWGVLFVAGSHILILFLMPTTEHIGINQYYKSKFMDMVQGTAYKPFVYRTLLPTTVRVISSITPNNIHVAISDIVEQHQDLREMFRIFRWETSASYQYLVAMLLMGLCFMAFAHYTARLSLQVSGIPDVFPHSLILAALVLMILPFFFKYASYPYDPPQLLLFTLALYFCANHETTGFFISFILCCINKETAVLLIPVFMLTDRKGKTGREFWVPLLGLAACYVVAQGLIRYLFRFNPGTLVEFHLDRNISLVLMEGWSLDVVTVCLLLAALLFYRWKEKPAFYKVSLFCILPPLAVLALFLGWFDEWRGYYEVYPIAFGLSVDTILRIKAALDRKRTNLPANCSRDGGCCERTWEGIPSPDDSNKLSSG